MPQSSSTEARWWRYFDGYWEEDDIYEHFQVSYNKWGLECYIWATEENREQIKDAILDMARYAGGEPCHNLIITTTLTV